jgi:hypothetical protein
MEQDYKALIESDRVSPQTREVLKVRGLPDDPGYRSSIFSDTQYATLHALAVRIIPQNETEDRAVIDLAARLDQQLASGASDGWRYATLPADTQAFRVALTLLDELARKLSQTSFQDLPAVAQDALLTAIAEGRMASQTFDLQRWFEDLRASLTGIYVSHPATLARMHYSGFADNPNGFIQIGIAQVEQWEPR